MENNEEHNISDNNSESEEEDVELDSDEEVRFKLSPTTKKDIYKKHIFHLFKTNLYFLVFIHFLPYCKKHLMNYKKKSTIFN